MADEATGEGGCGCMRPIARLLQGAEHFHTEVFPARRALFASLANSQAPGVLFIACADSRVAPEMITGTEPGEMFVCRNIGNIVPAYGEMLGGVSAVVEFATVALGVSDIVICGHSDCGAMRALSNPGAALEEMPTVRSWLRNAEAAGDVVAARQPQLSGEAALEALAEENVRLQLAHLRSHPAVAARLADGRLAIHGWIYRIAEGEIRVFDEQQRRLMTVEEARQRLRV